MLKTALRKPIAIIVCIAGLVLFSILATENIPINIFPSIDLPTIYVSQPYGGMSPQQMEALIASRYEDHFLYVSGIKTIQVQNIQGACLVKLSFYPGTDMAEAAAEVSIQVTRSKAFMPPGTVPPIVLRFDASSLPVGELVFTAPNRSLNDLQEDAGRIIRPMFAGIQGVSSPPPIGASSRTIVVSVDPQKMRAYNLTPDELVKAISDGNQIAAAGDVNIGNTTYMTPSNSLVREPDELLDLPVKTGSGPVILLGDVATVKDAGDITSGYALVNGKRAVYIPVLKRPGASTWTVVQNLKKSIPLMQSQLPPDIRISYEFDQSVYVINAVKSLAEEGIIGAVLTGLMVLLFLGDFRSAMIVIITIPVSIVIALLMLRLAGQTINIMTLSGMALAIGVLVDEATVAIENIHQHLEMGKPKSVAILEGIREIAFPLFLILLCVLAVFAPSFLMTGVPKSLFLPLSLAVGFSMIVSYLLSQTLVPILGNWMLKTEKFTSHHNAIHHSLALDKRESTDASLDEFRLEHAPKSKLSRFDRFKRRYIQLLRGLFQRSRLIIGLYVVCTFGLIALFVSIIGKDILPNVNSGQLQVRLREPDGTRFEVTEIKTLQVIGIIKKMVGPRNVKITSAYIGTQPNTYAVNNIYMFSSGPQEAVLQVALSDDYHTNMDQLKEDLRKQIHAQMPEMKMSFEPIDLVNKVMSEGSPTPIEVIVGGKDLAQGELYAKKVIKELDSIPFLRDVQIAEPLNYPIIRVHIDRERAGQLGLTADDVSRSLVAATSSSRYTDKVFWMDHKIGMGYQIQVEVPQAEMSSINDLGNIPLVAGQMRPLLRDVATFTYDTVPGEIDHIDGKRVVMVTANIYKKDLGSAATDVAKALKNIGSLPRGMTIETTGLIQLLTETLDSLQSGLLLAVVVIFLLLAANYQSFKLSFVVLCTVPAVITGSLIVLLITSSTLNLQSYMGIIMSIGISVSNAILLVTNAEDIRLETGDAKESAIAGAGVRIRPILMTTLAMVVGMIPMAMGIGEAGEQSAPLGRAVIGGLIASTLSALLILPLVFTTVQKRSSKVSVSLDPEDTGSEVYKMIHSNGHAVTTEEGKPVDAPGSVHKN